MPALSRTALLLTLLALTGAASRAQAAPPPTGPDASPLPGLAVVQPDALPGTVAVQPGDTAYSLARAHGLSIEVLLSLNSLSTPDLRVGQVLRVRALPPHSVQPGETLYGLSRRFGVSVDALLAANSLPRDVILEVGQLLRIPAPGSQVQGAAVAARPVTAPGPVAPGLAATPAAPAAPAPLSSAPTTVLPSPAPAPALPAAVQPGDWRGTALALLGVPYLYGGTTRSGLDCSGFLLQVFSPLGVQLPRRSADQARTGVPVALPDLQAGDLVFFDTVGRGEVTHIGIYLGDNQFVSANSYRNQVSLDRLQGDPYWGPLWLGARRVLPPGVYGAGR
jgi:peptidoglycan endopeptidase LytE